MRWQGREKSSNVEDRRGMRAGPAVAAGGGGILMVVIALVALFFGADPGMIRNLLQGPAGAQQQAGQQQQKPVQASAAEEELKDFVSVVLRDTEVVWNEQFKKLGKTYREPTLVIFRDQVKSACGFQSAAVGPFYCPGDQQVYVDLGFFEELKRNLGAPGDFAQAYVVAHEVGHHIQNLLGISDSVNAQRARLGKAEANELSVRLELQADFFAGVWAHHADRSLGVVERGDLEEALRAATAIGDDRLQMQSRGVIVPESFTHGTSEQRVRWFYKGYETGDMSKGDTFTPPYNSL